MAREELDREILAYIEKGISYHDEETFNNLALKEFNHQYYENQIYQNLCRSKGLALGALLTGQRYHHCLQMHLKKP